MQYITVLYTAQKTFLSSLYFLYFVLLPQRWLTLGFRGLNTGVTRPLVLALASWTPNLVASVLCFRRLNLHTWLCSRPAVNIRTSNPGSLWYASILQQHYCLALGNKTFNPGSDNIFWRCAESPVLKSSHRKSLMHSQPISVSLSCWLKRRSSYNSKSVLGWGDILHFVPIFFHHAASCGSVVKENINPILQKCPPEMRKQNTFSVAKNGKRKTRMVPSRNVKQQFNRALSRLLPVTVERVWRKY